MTSPAGGTAVRTGRRRTRRRRSAGPALGYRDDELGVERDRDRGRLGGRVVVAEVADDGAAAAHLGMGDLRQCGDEQRNRPLATRSEARTVACRTVAPTCSRPSCSRSSSRPSTRLMSTTTGGCTSRMLSSGTRLWPPASTLAPWGGGEVGEVVGDGRRPAVVEVGRSHRGSGRACGGSGAISADVLILGTAGGAAPRSFRCVLSLRAGRCVRSLLGWRGDADTGGGAGDRRGGAGRARGPGGCRPARSARPLGAHQRARRGRAPAEGR